MVLCEAIPDTDNAGKDPCTEKREYPDETQVSGIVIEILLQCPGTRLDDVMLRLHYLQGTVG